MGSIGLEKCKEVKVPTKTEDLSRAINRLTEVSDRVGALKSKVLGEEDVSRVELAHVIPPTTSLVGLLNSCNDSIHDTIDNILKEIDILEEMLT